MLISFCRIGLTFNIARGLKDVHFIGDKFLLVSSSAVHDLTLYKLTDQAVGFCFQSSFFFYFLPETLSSFWRGRVERRSAIDTSLILP